LANALLATDDWSSLLGAIIIMHALLVVPFYLMVGTRRNTGAVMGGADGDGKGKAEAKNGSMVCNLLAYNLLAVLYASFCAYTGTKAWFDGSAASIGGSLQERFYGFSEPNAKITRLTVAYELYNTLAVILLAEYRTPAFVGHHATCLILGLMSLHPFCHYYGLFFFGLTAISSVPLATAELLQICGLEQAQELCRVLFCVLFLVFRTCYWPLESYKYWVDALACLNGDAPVHSYPAHIFLLVSNIGLTTLQFYWTTLIFAGIAEKLNPPKKETKKSK